MKIYTNTKFIVAPESNKEELQDLLTGLKLSTEKQPEKGKFSIQFEPFKAIVLPTGLSYQQIKELLPEHHVEFRAIGDSEIELPFVQSKTYKHEYTPEEKAAIADEFCEKQEEKEALEVEKAEAAKKYKIKIDACETEIQTLAQQHRQGWEEKTAECFVRLDFVGKVKYFIHKETKEVLATDELNDNDRQLRIDSIPISNGKTANNKPKDKSNESKANK